MPGPTDRRPWPSPAAPTVLLALLALLAMLALPAPAEAASGTWGAGHYRYADGRVCRSGTTTTPLAAWTVSGGDRAYLTRSVTSNGHVDSAVPPVPSAGTPAPAFDVTPGEDFPTAADVSAYAYLLSHGGDAAYLAAAVLSGTDPNGVPTCVDAGAASALLAAARLRAGPYQVTVDVPGGAVRTGQPVTVSASVLTMSGDPVPDARVTFSASGAAFAHSPVTTDDQGVARTSMTLAESGGPDATVTATTSVAIGLREASISATSSPTNPTGSSVPAVYAAPPTSYSGQAALTVDRTPHPVVTTMLPSRLVRASAAFRPQAQVSGLNGHAADVTFRLYGPLSLDKRSACTGIQPSAWAVRTLPVKATTSVHVTGDGTAQGGELLPAAAGCYALRTTVATTDATPIATRTSPPTVVTAVDTAITSDDATPAVFAGAPTTLTGAAKVTDTYGLAATMTITLAGPIRPANGDCGSDASGWRHAARQSVGTSIVAAAGQPANRSVRGAGDYRYRAAGPDALGCYRAQPVLTLTDPDGARLRLAAEVARPVYVLHPAVTAAVSQTWSVSPNPVHVQVTVDGLFGLAAHVRTRMYVAAPPLTGCGQARFTSADRSGTGPATAVAGASGPVTVDVTSGATKRLGCYAVVPELSIDVAPKVRVVGALGVPGTTLIAGIDPNQRHGSGQSSSGSGTGLEFPLTMLGVAVLLLAVAARVGVVAWRGRDGSGEDRWPADPLDLGSGGLPSGA